MSKDYLKYLAKQNPKTQLRILKVLEKILTWNLVNLDYKELAGKKGLYRARVGKFRIVFARQENGRGAIIDINTRGDIY